MLKRTLSRLLAVCAVYSRFFDQEQESFSRDNPQNVKRFFDLLQSETDVYSVDVEYKEKWEKAWIDYEFFHVILQGVLENQGAIREKLNEITQSKGGMDHFHFLFQSILYVASFEFMQNVSTSSKIVIKEYLKIGDSYFDSSEITLLHPILDQIAVSFQAGKEIFPYIPGDPSRCLP